MFDFPEAAPAATSCDPTEACAAPPEGAGLADRGGETPPLQAPSQTRAPRGSKNSSGSS